VLTGKVAGSTIGKHFKKLDHLTAAPLCFIQSFKQAIEQ